MLLGLNIDHIATLREARKGLEPEPVLAALIAEASGADSIVVHLREDRRHIQDDDIFILRKIIKTRLNLEMSIAKEIVDVALKAKPDQATFVPEKRRELTTEGGLNVVKNFRGVKEALEKLDEAGVDVSIFIDPDKQQIRAAKKAGARKIELHTGCYANAKNKSEERRYLKELSSAAKFAYSLGFDVFAGHGLNYCNVFEIIKIKEISELNIGHAIIARAVFCGLGQAVREMKELIG
jgi:pyridoxine 5-phosphate synthase